MKNQSRAGAGILVAVSLFLSFGSFANTKTHSLLSNINQKESVVTKHASGTFEVKLNPQVDDKVGDPTVGRMSIDKQFHGDLEGNSKGQMLADQHDLSRS